MKKRTAMMVAPVAALAFLASCMHLPPIDVGDPLELDGTQIGMVSLDHMNFDDGAAPSDLAPATNFIDPAFGGPTLMMPFSGFVNRVAEQNPNLGGSLPPQMPNPPAPPSEVDPRLIEQILGEYMGTPNRDLPDNMTADQLKNTRLAAVKQLEERHRKIQEERDAARRKQLEDQRDKAEANLRRLLEEALRQRAADRAVELNLPMPFYVEGGSLNMELPSAARFLANGYRQDVSIAELELTVPAGVVVTDYPPELQVHGLSVTLIAAQRNPSTNAVSTLLSFERTIVHDQETALVFQHVADGIYRPVSDDRVFELWLNQADTRALYNAISGDFDIYGNADFALSLAPALSSQVAVNFTLQADHAFIRP